MKLYYTPGVCSLSPHIVMREAGVPVDLKKVDMFTKVIDGGGNYLEVNPKGYVPAIELPDGGVLTEMPAIVQYIADHYPDAGLAPPNGTMERYRLQEMLTLIGTEVHKMFTAFHYPKSGPEWKEFATMKITRRFAYFDELLSDRAFLMGDNFSVADAYLFTTLTWTPNAGLDRASWPNLNSYFERIRARPTVQAAMRAEGLI